MEIQNKQSETLLRKYYKDNNDFFRSINKMILDETTLYLRKRYLITFLAFLGWCFLYLLRTNLSISMVAMTSTTNVTIGNETFVRPAEFNWTSVDKGLILSAFSWGLFASPIGAYLSIEIGGATVFGFGIAATGLLTLITPLLIQWNTSIYLFARILEGVTEGFSAAGSTNVLTHWAPPSERTRLFACMSLGGAIGTMLSYPICGTVAFYLEWKAVFYVTGGAAIVWYAVWLVVASNSPTTDKYISTTERKYFNEVNQYLSNKKIIYPWIEIFKSKAVWAFVNDRFVEGWSLSFLTYCLPLYMKDSHDSDIQNIGFLSGFPHVCAVVGTIVGSFVADYLRIRRLLSITNVHRVYLTFAQTAAVILLSTIAWWKNPLVSVICIALFRLLYTICDISYQVLPVDIGGQFGSLVSGLGMMGISLAYACNPIVMGILVRNHTIDEWSQYFLFLSIFNLWGGIIFYFFGSGDLQPWALIENQDEMKKREELSPTNQEKH